MLVKIFGYLKHATGRRKSIIISLEYIRDISSKGYNTTDCMENYPDTMKGIDEELPEP